MEFGNLVNQPYDGRCNLDSLWFFYLVATIELCKVSFAMAVYNILFFVRSLEPTFLDDSVDRTWSAMQSGWVFAQGAIRPSHDFGLTIHIHSVPKALLLFRVCGLRWEMNFVIPGFHMPLSRISNNLSWKRYNARYICQPMSILTDYIDS